MPKITDRFDPKDFERLVDLVNRWWRIDVLVVADSIVSFGPEHDPANLNESYFGMSHLMGVLESVATVTRAHRTSDPLRAPGVLSDFRFDRHDLSRYDQIWLLGYATGALDVAEQAAVARFMNSGGGVFATGDHATLGSALAGQLPRVRSMRRWDAPPPLGPTRVDTTVPDVNDVVVFENQSDDIPQHLRIKKYPWASHRWFREEYPHPLLCSPSGPITEFPDHMHEGEIVEPATLDARINLPGLEFDEYPAGADGRRVAPEVVAWGHTTGRASPAVMTDVHTGALGPANERWTGTIGVYDGRRAGVGRVVVHSTWHHFFDINLIGDNAANRPSVTDPRAAIWRKGFTGSANGQRVLSQLDQYFCNIVRWLTPNALGRLPLASLVAQLTMTHHIREVLQTEDVSAREAGAYAWPYALRLAPPCTIIELVFEPLAEVIQVPIVPWDPPRPPGADDRLPWSLPLGTLAEAALGGALLAFAGAESLDDLEQDREGTRVRQGAVEGARVTLRAELETVEASLKHLRETLERLA